MNNQQRSGRDAITAIRGKQGVAYNDLNVEKVKLGSQRQRVDKIPVSAIAKPSEGTSQTSRIVASAVRSEYAYGALGIVLGFTCVIGGIILGLHGVAGGTSWSARFLGLESKINDAAPGVVLFIVGVFLVLITKPRVRLRDLND